MCSVCLFLIISLITKAKPHKQLKCKHQRISQQQLGTTHTHTDRVKHRTGIIEAEQADTMLMVLVVLVGGGCGRQQPGRCQLNPVGFRFF